MATPYAKIPQPPKWPILGHTPQYFTNPVEFVLETYQRYGDVIRYNVAWEDTLVLFGPDAAQFVLGDKTKAFSSRLGWQFRLEQFFRNGLMLRDFEEHRFHRGVMQSAFTKKALKGYMDIMNETIQARMKEWQAADDFLFYPAFKQLTLDVASTSFLGLPLGDEAKRVNTAFTDAVAAAMAVVRLPIPGNTWSKGLKGRAFLIEFLRGQIPEKRKHLGNDLFSQMCTAKNEAGESLSDDEIIDHMIFLMMAAHDTITSAVTTLVFMLAKHRDWQDRVRQEVASLIESQLSYENIGALNETEWCYHEAMRLYPPVHFIPRRTTRELNYKGFQIPANTQVACNVITNHRMKEWWTAPESFDPLRFSPERAEHKQHKHLFIPYGTGAHTCIGMHFAAMQVKAFMLQFLLNFEIDIKPGQKLKHNLIPIPKPTDGLPVKLTRITEKQNWEPLRNSA